MQVRPPIHHCHRQQATKLRAVMRYNTKVQPQAFQPDDLVWRV